MPTQPVPMGSGSAKKDPPVVQVDPKAAKPKGPHAIPAPPKSTKKKASKKAAKKKATRKPAAAVAKEVDAAGLEPTEARKRCAAIYKFERKVEAKRKLHDLAKAGAKSAKAQLTDAEDALEQEIREQRFGPGPLFPVE